MTRQVSLSHHITLLLVIFLKQHAQEWFIPYLQQQQQQQPSESGFPFIERLFQLKDLFQNAVMTDALLETVTCERDEDKARRREKAHKDSKLGKTE